MNTSGHVTKNQIAAFGAGSLAASDSLFVGGHLIRCLDCRRLLPTPNRNQVWNAVTSEHDFDESPRTIESSSVKTSHSQIVANLFGKRHRLAWAAGIVAVVFGLAGVFIFSVSKRQGIENEVARSFELENPGPTSNQVQPNTTKAEDMALSESNPEIKKTVTYSKDRELPKNESKSNSSARVTDRVTPRSFDSHISASRGSIEPCSTRKTIEVGLGSHDDNLIIRWKSVPNAAKYHLYVSDDNEILVDEFETEQGTSYVLKKPIDPTKSYKFKIVVTLNDGQTLYTDVQKFTTKDFLSSVNGYKRSARSNTRCLAN